jgi:allene oxide cyclase
MLLLSFQAFHFSARTAHRKGSVMTKHSNPAVSGRAAQAMSPWLAAAAAALVFGRPAIGAEQIKVVERPVGETTVDLTAKGDSVGDMLVFANGIFDAANKTQVGTDQGYCVRTIVGKSWECFWTLTLKAGQITVEGPFLDEGDSLFAVTGGTGKYAGAKGSMKLHPRDPTPTAYDFTYDLL